MPRGSETVLLVEDEESLRRFLRQALQGAGYRVLEAADGVRARELAEQQEGLIHLLLTDVVMPGQRGPALARELRSARADMKVVFMSGYTGDDAVEREITQSGTPCVQKPCTLDVLLAKVREVLDRT